MTLFRYFSVVALVFVLASCGRNLPDSTPAPRPTATVVSDTATEPTETDATAESAPIVVDDSADESIRFLADANPANGQTLYNEVNSTGFACSGCHSADTENRLIGPGLYNVPLRAETRVDGEVAQRYLYNSILHPNDYIVEGDPAYPTGLMPQNYAEIYADDQIYDIIAYLMTLSDAPAVAQAPAEVTTSAEQQTSAEVAVTVIVVVTATPAPTLEVVATEAPTAEDVTAVPTESVEYSAEDVRQQRLLGVGNAAFGETAFNASLVDTTACSDCHASDSSDPGAEGPGLLGSAATIIEANPNIPPDVAVYNALLNSETHADLYTTYVEQNSFLDLANIVAYLMTLDATVDPETGLTSAEQSIIDSVLVADSTHGETLFNEMNASGFACSNCHLANSEDRLIGPGLLGIPTRAETRVEGQPGILYLWQSIANPNAYLVEGEPAYPASLMPQNYSDLYTQEDIYDIIAYLLTLEE